MAPHSLLSLSSSFRAFKSKTPREQRHSETRSNYRGPDNKNTKRDHFFSPHLEKQIKEHINNFPSQLFVTRNSTALAAWHRTAMELVMNLSKLWGRSRESNKTSPEQLDRAVLLANDLVTNVLSIRDSELDKEDNPHNITKNRFIESQVQSEPKKVMPNGVQKLSTETLVNTVALGFSRCDPKVTICAAQKAQELLDRLEEINIKHQRIKNKRNLSFKQNDVFPTTKIYNHVLNCWSRSTSKDAETHAVALLRRMAAPQKDGISFPRPDIISYNNVLNLYASRGDVVAAEALLNQLEESENEITADVYSYTIVMNAMQRKFLSGKGERSTKEPKCAEELLARLVRKYEESGFTDSRFCPTSVTFGTVLSMYAAADRLRKENLTKNQSRSWLSRNLERSSRRIVSDVAYLGWGAENAGRVLEWIVGLSERERRSRGVDSADAIRHARDQHHQRNRCSAPSLSLTQNTFIRPCVQHFVTTADAWAKAGKGVEGAEKCESLKNRNISLYESTGYSELKPNLLLFGAVIDAWARANEDQTSAEHAEGLLDEVERLFLHSHSSDPKERLSNIVYNQVIDAWSRRLAPDRAEKVLRRLMDIYLITHNDDLRPDVISYTGVIKAFVGSPNGGEKALELFDEMKNEYINGNKRAKPDEKTIAVVIDACVKSGLSSDAERIFSGIDDSKKNAIMFNTILTGYKHEGRYNEAESMLRKMIALSNEGHNDCSPNALTYSLCIGALSKSKDEVRVIRAGLLLNETIQRYHAGDIKCKPSTDLFNTVALVIANSDVPNRENEVLALFEKMESNGCTPSLVSFNILIKTCSKAEMNNARNALQIAASAYNNLDAAGLTADSVTYVSMVRAILNLMSGSVDKTDALTALFRKCCDGGFLNQHIINILSQETSQAELQSITGISPRGPDILQIQDLPNEWSQNSSI